MRAKIAILVSKFLREDGSLEIGGIETYVQQLLNAIGSSYEHYVFQPGRENASYTICGTRVVVRKEASIQNLADYISGSFLSANDIFVVSTEQLGIKTRWKRAIVIQHGIYWDLPAGAYSSGRFSRLAPNAYKIFDNYRNLKRIASFSNIVCVDHAYVNWYRTLTGQREESKKFHVILNHADISFHEVPAPSIKNGVSILFARRLMRFRGTLLFARVARSLLDRNGQLTVTICGSGPDEAEMKAILPPGSRVDYRIANHHEMAALVSQHDIVVVPSLGSEGTSLSAIEGMAAGRAVVASAVGGLPNLIIDGYNGALVFPDDEPGLLSCLQRLVTDDESRVAMAGRARRVARHSFNFEVWSEQWRQVIAGLEEHR